VNRSVEGLEGILAPMVTPLHDDERVDEAALRRLVDFLVTAGVHAIWALGTTGEFAGLSAKARATAVETTVDAVAGRIPVIANVGDSGTNLALGHAQAAVAAGVDGLALTPPHYFPHSMDEVRAHFEAVKSRFSDLPLFAYNIPQTVKVAVPPATILDLAQAGAIQGIKDSQNDLQAFRRLALAVHAQGLSPGFRMFLGTRCLIDVAAQVGAHGAVPAFANIAPRACVEAWRRSRSADPLGAADAQAEVMSLEELVSRATGGSANAAVLGVMKTVLKHWGVLECTHLTRPLRNLSPADVEAVTRALDELQSVSKTYQREYCDD
jgi:4-hydroxy-tetrahydrodipicolinate synthase